MTRTLKTLGLTLAALLAFGAASVSTASAETKIEGALTTTPSEFANLVGEQSGANHKFEIGGGIGTLECGKVVMKSTLSGLSTSATIESTYESCTFNSGGTKRPTTITMNGCLFTMTVHEFYSGSGKGSGQGHLTCPEGKSIEIHVYQSGDTQHKESPRCTYDIHPQTISTGLEFQTMESGGPSEKPTMTVIIKEAPVTAKKTSGTVLQCGGTEVTSKYTGTSEIVASNAEGKQIGLDGVEH